MLLLRGTSEDPDVLIIKGKHKIDDRRTVDRVVRYWAERGLIRVEDSLDNSYEVLSVRKFLQHAAALSKMVGNSSSNKDSGADATMRTEMQRIIDRSVELARKAQIQGMPDDPSANRARRRGRPVSVVVPGGKAVM
jgi:hypothetical protein